MKKIFETLSKYKGAIATVIGFVFVLPVNILIINYIFRDIEPTQNRLIWAGGMNFIGMMWFILPSKIKITSKLFSVELED